MNFALLGDDPVVLPFVCAIADHGEHRIACAALVGGLQSELRSACPGLQIAPSWDRILTVGNVDTVVVCGSSEEILEAAKQIASAGKSLAIYPKSTQGSTWIYELALIRDEGRTSLVPVFIDRLRPEFQALRDAVTAPEAGRILYLRIDRDIVPIPRSEGFALLSKHQVEDALLHDADILRGLGGNYSRVSAVYSGTVDDRVAAASVTLLGDQLPEATWTARATSGSPKWTLVIARETGEITVTADGKPLAWNLQSGAESLPAVATLPPFYEGERILQSIEQKPSRTSGAAQWIDLVRAFEIVDAARVSIRRRRAIDLHFETTSERNIFKSQMTAVGCLLMMMTLLGVVFLLVVMPVLDVRGRPQLEAERAGSIIRPSEFKPMTAELTDEGMHHLQALAPRMAGTRFPVLIEPGGPPPSGINERRRDAVVAYLEKQGVKDDGERVRVEAIFGQWYQPVLKVTRVLVFVPLALFLLLQVFLFLTRPATK